MGFVQATAAVQIPAALAELFRGPDRWTAHVLYPLSAGNSHESAAQIEALGFAQLRAAVQAPGAFSVWAFLRA
jgi:hypothetical protein